MFEAFQPGASDGIRKRRLAASTVAAAGAYLVAAVAVATLARGATVEQEKMLDVTFDKPIAKAEVAPPPLPPPAAKKAEKPKPLPAAQSTLVPKAVPKDVLPESDHAIEKGEYVPPAEGIGGEASRERTDAPAVVLSATTTAPPRPVVRAAPEPINLPEEATPPVESPDNRRPEYPESARAAGLEGVVILKIVVTEKGTVGTVLVMKGEPPFVEAALAAVKTYRYQPAMLAGHPIAVFRIVKVPFRLSVGGGR
jgi:periplasmic protein TonB